MEEILKIQKPIVFDESIAHYEIHAHQPFASATFNNNDEIRIASSIKICACCRIRYELNAIVIDRNKNVGNMTLMKNYVSQTPDQAALLENAGWVVKDNESAIIDANGYFDISIPLSMLLGFAEDDERIIVNAKHELILIRGNTDMNAVIQAPAGEAAAEAFRLSLDKVEWMVLYIRETYEYPLLPATSKHVWVVKCSTQLEKPRYIIAGFQTKRKTQTNKNASHFDHCNILDIKLFLNSQSYPYGSLNIDIRHNQYALLYDMYSNFQSSYYGKEAEPLLSKTDFLIVTDCSKQNEYLKPGPVDIRLEFESDPALLTVGTFYRRSTFISIINPRSTGYWFLFQMFFSTRDLCVALR
ncbi:uncharacterized protein LOC107042301 [Diachasma alloeum]|uniref:uncharacterized protein LOC107042301 n=1 Tax=Diachasma alloeum TaxID=454923 RepID=UPI0007381741|nr:uncharacterized protein LOC107042301 [Diachasma alloeum]